MLKRALALVVVGGMSVVGCGEMKHDEGMSSDKPMMKSDMSSSGGMMSHKDIVETAMGPEMPYTTLVAAVKEAGLVGTLKGAGPYTVFAPTDEAFAKLPAGTVDELMKPENKEKLRSILLYHVVPGKESAAQVMMMNSAKTAEGEKLWIKSSGGKVMVGNDKAWATVIKTDVQASNGTIHWIDTVLMP